MKKTILTIAATTGLTGLVSAISLDLSAPPAGVTVSSPSGVSGIFGVDSLLITTNAMGIITFGYPVDVTFDIIDLDTVTATETAIVDGGSTYTGVSFNIPNASAATTNVIPVSLTNVTQIKVTGGPVGSAFGIANVTYVPEPSSAALASLGLLALARRRRK